MKRIDRQAEVLNVGDVPAWKKPFAPWGGAGLTHPGRLPSIPERS
jgi:hypothetical protein